MSLFTPDVISGFKIMLYGLCGVFGILIVFFVLMKILLKIYPEEQNNSNN